MITDQNRKDYAELVELIKRHSYQELREILEITQEDDDFIDFHFKSLIATIYKGGNTFGFYLTGWCDLELGNNRWLDHQQMGNKVMIKYA